MRPHCLPPRLRPIPLGLVGRRFLQQQLRQRLRERHRSGASRSQVPDLERLLFQSFTFFKWAFATPPPPPPAPPPRAEGGYARILHVQAARCKSDWDCSLAGTCASASGKCTCDAWATGTDCSYINLKPVDRKKLGYMDPTVSAQGPLSLPLSPPSPPSPSPKIKNSRDRQKTRRCEDERESLAARAWRLLLGARTHVYTAAVTPHPLSLRPPTHLRSGHRGVATRCLAPMARRAPHHSQIDWSADIIALYGGDR